HVILTEAQDVAALELVRILAAERSLIVVDIGAVAGGVLQQVAALVEDDACMASGYVSHVIRQHPIVLGGTSNAPARNSKDERALLAHSVAMIADDAQPERH